MSSAKIRFAVLGCGHIGTRHADMIMANDGCELVAVIDAAPALQNRVEKDYQVPFFSSLEAFLASDTQADVVNIATPNALHAAQALACIKAGCHVVIEKPMALTTADCNSILECAATHDRQVFCVMQNRYSAPMRWLKELVTQGILGDIYMVNVHCYWNRDERYYTGKTWHGTKYLDGGTLFTQFSHYVDLLYWVFGDVQDITARFANNNHKEMIDFEDSADISFRFNGGGMGSLSYSTSVWDRNMESTLVVVAEKGTVKIGGQYMDKIEYCHIKDYELKENISSHNLQVNGYTGAKANHYYVIQNVVDVLKGSSGITTNAMEGTKVVEIIEHVYALKD
ncbi:MAG: Gfo/Idh/MocA family oxidoreductase [Chitinophagaceae bacterium]|nr:Gfo/Idh/MocA family oxidoreductase [Chitinophagaceae bacterium]MCB9044847.1 Gfo/Idh/MocA family oxidoreductase [Chitinophagales bacterium]